MIIDYLNRNAANAQRLVRDAVRRLSAEPRTCKHASALRHAILTPREAVTPEARRRLSAIIGKYVS
jgi:5'-methylthioadenosine phosphorylase